MHALTGRPRYGDVPPNQTLYVNNLNEKIKVPEMKCSLLELFGTYGEVIDIVAFGTLKKKGQAFVVFREISCATNAMRALQNFVFLDKPMKINYSKTKSDVVAVEDGTFKPRGKGGAKEKEEPAKPKGPGPARPKAAEAKAKAAANDKAVAKTTPAAEDKEKDEDGDKDGQPSNVLFVENLPPEVNEMMLTMLFRQYPGFQEARLIKGRNVAFIEYADELQAGIAKHGLQGFMVTPEMALKISFAKQ
jgi:RNA recognition motif-containing protein